MMPSDIEILQAILRSDFPSFLHKMFQTLHPGQRFVAGWHIRAIAHQLERVLRGEIKRLIINMPPRSLKSFIASVAFPAFILGNDPTRKIICASYSGELGHKFSNDFRAAINSNWFRQTFPNTRIGDKDSEGLIRFTRRGFRYSTSVGGTLTGWGGSLIIIDDPLKPIDALSEVKRNAANEWMINTVLSRLDDKRADAIVIVMQRVHLDDLTGFVQGLSDDWTVLSLPAIAVADERIPLTRGEYYQRKLGEALSAREPLTVLEQMRKQLGSDVFSAQYQQAPVPPGGAMIKRAWVQRYRDAPMHSPSRFIIQSWDTAAKGGPDNDWSVCTTWLRTECQWFLLDLWRGRVDYPGLKTKVECLAGLWTANEVLVEDAGTATALLDELRFSVPGIVGIKPERDKQTRMSIASAKFAAKQVHFPESAAWLPVLESELFSFPGGKYDDQVDSISQALNYEDSDLWVWRKLGGE